MKTAEEPFGFIAASYLTRINNQQASSLRELRAGLDQASDASIFYHTFQSLGRHRFLVESFSNDFAQWVPRDPGAGCWAYPVRKCSRNFSTPRSGEPDHERAMYLAASGCLGDRTVSGVSRNEAPA